MEFNYSFKYIKVVELHLSDYAHLHILLNEFIDFDIFNHYFDANVRNTCNELGIVVPKGKICNCNFSPVTHSKVLAKYVLNYITKTIDYTILMNFISKIYTKSRNIVFFEFLKKIEPESRWFVFIQYKFTYRDSFYLYHKRIFPQDFSWKDFIKEEILKNERKKLLFLELGLNPYGSNMLEISHALKDLSEITL